MKSGLPVLSLIVLQGPALGPINARNVLGEGTTARKGV